MDWLDNIVFNIGNFGVTWGGLLLQIMLLLILLSFYLFILLRFLPIFFEKELVSSKERIRIRRLLAFCFVLAALVSVRFAMGADYTIYQSESFQLRVSTLLQIFLLIQLARLLDIVVSKYLVHAYRETHEDEYQRPGANVYADDASRKSPHRMVQQVVYVTAVLLMVRAFDIDWKVLSIPFNDKLFEIRISSLLIALLVILVAQLINWILIQIILFNYYKTQEVDIGRQYAINKLMVYFIYVAAILIALQTLGLNLTLIWGGLAALALGVGLGLQQTFNDLASGLILLFERTVAVGDIVQLDGDLIGRVQRIGLRTSVVETHSKITVIVPNSKLVTNKIVNWNHFDDLARFSVRVHVAYGSDTDLVKKLLIEVAHAHPKVLATPEPFVRLIDFGNHAIDFELFFWSKELFPIENVKSELRFAIDQIFRAHQVVIPLPQRDIWFRNTATTANNGE